MGTKIKAESIGFGILRDDRTVEMVAKNISPNDFIKRNEDNDSQ